MKARSRRIASKKKMPHVFVLCEHNSMRQLFDLSAAATCLCEKLPGRYRRNHQVRWVLYWEPCVGHCWFVDGD